ncbi:DEAD/DEAH box helicase [Bathymodiolus septemdierum thioautotrophic gill symbiont]|uniref:Helicase ATP-binding domain-containing protein n=1 Tax=endosymbiont of Bathymodiolus septemdierum str. Myojin knoll TaxID=1303921 RepID=A0A0N7KBJ0_9GAMM|nr:DEAD/DEAH box helicase [Bathymodiolus septemdierum thioautotrophic gill symbiont]BAS68151.1 conserved hypothetical protein [endosymbiont of Bathymodiolus septemdierum str. Myojin knoll]
MDIFKNCQNINSLISSNEEEAREKLIKLLDSCNWDISQDDDAIEYSHIINNLIRQLGLYPYLNISTSSWQENFIYEAFKTDVGDDKPITLHREQSSVLKDLIDGKNLAIIAPTSFGKSFIIDAFIALKQPKNIVIIVPTIALTDETRRRLQKKFSDRYKIITTSEIELGEKNIFIFPQERALHYVDKIAELDMLVIDEFYKASADFDKQRSTSLLNAILKLGEKSKQKYFLAPNISEIQSNPFTEGMEIERIDFNTVFLNIHDTYKTIKNNDKKSELLKILNNTRDKTLIYAGTFTQIAKLSEIVRDDFPDLDSDLLNNFSQWVATNYSQDWELVNLIKKGTGVHNGRLHRSLSQIQIKLFDKDDGLKNIISTSSIIEGVNTSAKNIIFFGRKNGNSNLKYFDYKNLIGRGGRMFKHFIGEIYLLEKPPEEEGVQLSLEVPKELIDENNIENFTNNNFQKEAIDFYGKMNNKLGGLVYKKLRRQSFFEENNWTLIEALADDMIEKPGEWNGLNYLNTVNTGHWERHLYKVLKIAKRGPSGELVKFIKISPLGWDKSIPNLINKLDISVNKFFELEKKVSFSVSNIFNCVNILQKEILPNLNTDISPFTTKLSYAFLPKNVYLLEEYGLPRMISKKIHLSGLINLENNDRNLHSIIDNFNEVTCEKIIQQVESLDDFDKYILKYFFNGIKR